MVKKKKKILITGGAGFIGSNSATYFLKKGWKVVVLDNFSRPGGKENVKWLRSLGGDLEIVRADIRSNLKILTREVSKADAVLHLAAQVAVTTSVENPREDFEINALGTFNVLEAIRKSSSQPFLIYSLTNKVYGGMEGVEVEETKNGYVYRDFPHGISENFPLDFHSPYGCSKGAADQYVRDYARIYGLKTVVFRQSCIYGPRQFGVEVQGWVAWFVIAAVLNKPITIYGDGKQVRDILYVDDLVRAYELAFNQMDKIKGEVFNIGGGPKFTMSIWKEFRPLLENYLGKKIKVSDSCWRPGDQKIYVSDVRKAKRMLGWQPMVTVAEGVKKLCSWVDQNETLLKKVLG
ncbi:GDP-mannose 4,6-dehydratase [Patescibacteria group bacterium]|nr:GDP-mannose 4,6-dehydratase [Patescibacteria group bacterium]